MSIDFLIVGGGLSGMWVAYYLLQHQQRIMLIDEGLPKTASGIASGVMNPITGKYLIKTWRADDFFPHAQQAYPELCALLGLPDQTFRPIDIVWLIKQAAQFDEMAQLSQKTDIAPFVRQLERGTFLPILQTVYGHISIKGYQIALHDLLPAFHHYLAQHNAIRYQKVAHEQWQITAKEVVLGDIRAKNVIFCEGIAALQNPFFSHLPLVPLKGERLLLRIPSMVHNNYLLKTSGISIVPHVAPDVYWAGSNYEHWNNDATPTTTQRQKFELALQQLLNTPYEIIDHQAAIRPAVLHRYPFVGRHLQYPQLSVLNGMGTKGTTLSPYFAQQLVQHLLYGQDIDEEVRIN